MVAGLALCCEPGEGHGEDQRTQKCKRPQQEPGWLHNVPVTAGHRFPSGYDDVLLPPTCVVTHPAELSRSNREGAAHLAGLAGRATAARESLAQERWCCERKWALRVPQGFGSEPGWEEAHVWGTKVEKQNCLLFRDSKLRKGKAVNVPVKCWSSALHSDI